MKRIIRRPPITPNRAQQIRFRHLQRASTAAAEAKRKSEETHESETQKKPRSDEQHTSIDLTVDNTTANDVDSVTSKTTVTPDMSEEVKRLQAEVNRLRGLEESHTHARELKEANEALKSRLANHEKEIAFQKIRESRLESEVETLRRCNRTFEDMNGRLRAQNAMLRVKVQDCVTCRNNRIEMRTLYDKLKEAERSQNGGKGVPKKREGWTARHKPVVDNVRSNSLFEVRKVLTFTPDTKTTKS